MGRALRLIILTTLLGFLFVYVVDISEVLHLLDTFDLRYAALAVLVLYADRALMTYKWSLLLRAQGHRLPLIDGIAIYCSSMLWGTVLPSTLGADAIRAVLVVRQRGIPGSDVVASIMVERLVGFIVGLLLGIGSLATLRYIGLLPARYHGAELVGALLLSGAVGLLVISMNATMAARLGTMLPDAVRESRPVRAILEAGKAYHALGAARRTIVWFAILSFVEQFSMIALTWTLARGVGVPVDALVLLGVVPVAMLISRLPITIDGLGVYEAIFAGLLSLAGVSPNAAIAIALSGRIIQLLCFVPWWLVQVQRSGEIRPPSLVEAPLPGVRDRASPENS
jgi:uncharacterized protein (TIRG00374 family)